MTTLQPATTHPSARTPVISRRRVTFPRTVLSEWIKFRSLRSTTWTLVATVALAVGISVLAAWGTTTETVRTAPGSMNAAQLLSAGYQVAQLAVAVLAVLTITGEYSTGMIRSTFAAVPSRVPVLAAKALVLSVAVAVVAAVSMGLSYLATMPFHDDLNVVLDLTDAETRRMTIGLPLYLAAIALLAFALGALIRHTAGALAVVLGLLLVVENVFTLMPLRFFEVVSPFLPATAGSRILLDTQTLATINAATEGARLTPWQGYTVLIAWVAALLASAAFLVRRRDA